MKTRVLLRLLILFAAIIPAALLFQGCPPREEPPLSEQLEIDSTFRLNPPVPEMVNLEKLEAPVKEGNFLLTAAFDDVERKKIGKRPYLVILRGDEKVVLRDDGKDGDKTAGDNIFSLVVSEDEGQIRERIAKANNIIAEQENNVFTFFRMRQRFERTIEPFNAEAFERGRPLRIDDLNFVLFRTDPSLLDHSLTITSVNIVEDPTRTILDPCNPAPGEENKPWTFAKLMTDLANEPSSTVSVSDFTLNWLETWMSDQTVNTFTVPKRDLIESMIIQPWKDKSNFIATGKLDMKFAPFKLIAIVNRIDLRESIGYGGTNAGEGRFVFCPLDENCNPITNFTVIFEYGVNIKGCANVKAYAQQWYDLKNIPLTDPNFNTQLQAITDQFALANTNPKNPNRSSLNQLRTNENALLIDWELREFKIGASHFLEPVTVKQEPAEKYNNVSPLANSADVAIMAQWANTNNAAILANAHVIPEIEPVSGQPFLGGRSLPGIDFNYHWNGEPSGTGFITSDEGRHLLSLKTCGGCHAGETGTKFLHIIPPASFGGKANLSGFLTGITVPDPAGRPGPPVNRSFHDLQDRANKLEALVNSNCRSIFDLVAELKFARLKMVH